VTIIWILSVYILYHIHPPVHRNSFELVCHYELTISINNRLDGWRVVPEKVSFPSKITDRVGRDVSISNKTQYRWDVRFHSRD